MIYLGIIGCIVLIIFSWIKLNDIISPPFIICSIWVIIYLMLLFRNENIDFSSLYFLAFFIGAFFFVIGFFTVVRKKYINKNYNCKEEFYVDLNYKNIKIIILIISLIVLFFTIKVINFVRLNFSYNFWQTLSIGRKLGIFNEGIIVSYSKNAIIALTIICSIVCSKNPNKRNVTYFTIAFISSILLTATSSSRGSIFMVIIGVFFSFMIIKRYSNKKKLIILIIILFIVLFIFLLFASFKYVYTDFGGTKKFIISQIRVYFSTSTLAFVEWIENFDCYLYGLNTFKFFAALFNSIGYDINVPSNIQSFIEVYGDSTNVYTILQYYASDFGLIYAFMVQFFLGIIYGALYKKSYLNNSIFFTAILSILYFPLINQFFDDKYFSIFSTWIQITFWFFFFTRKKFLIYKRLS